MIAFSPASAVKRVVGWLLRTLQSWGVDRAIAYTVLGRGWSALSGPISLLFIARFLSPPEQGFYYTFGSVLGLQIFFELGLSVVILHFASHEKSGVEWTARGTLEGDPIAKARLASVLRKSLVWYGWIAVLMVVVILPAGLLFFGKHQPAGVEVAWRLPWTWLVLVSAGALFMSPIFAVLEGCGLVAPLARMRAYQGVMSSLLLWLTLSLGWKLFAAPVLSTASLIWGFGWLVLYRKTGLIDLLSFRSGPTVVDWWKEVWHFQWKIALSWLSNYFIFQLFNPVLFAYHGAVVAGQMGMSGSVAGAIWALAAAWVGTKAAPFGMLIAKREFAELDRLFFASFRQSTLVVALAGGAFWAVAFYLHSIDHSLGRRLLGPFPLALLLATNVLNLVMYAQAIYLRSHKREPFLVLSLVIACLVGLSTYFLGRPFGATGMLAGYFAITLLVGVVGGSWIFVQKRREWHGESARPRGVRDVPGQIAPEAS